MTEDEAKTKWCPYCDARQVQMVTEIATTEDVNNAYNKSFNCIASDCMMWVWDRGDAMINGILESDVLLDTGYCGLVRIS